MENSENKRPHSSFSDRVIEMERIKSQERIAQYAVDALRESILQRLDALDKRLNELEEGYEKKLEALEEKYETMLDDATRIMVKPLQNAIKKELEDHIREYHLGGTFAKRKT